MQSPPTAGNHPNSQSGMLSQPHAPFHRSWLSLVIIQHTRPPVERKRTVDDLKNFTSPKILKETQPGIGNLRGTTHTTPPKTLRPVSLPASMSNTRRRKVPNTQALQEAISCRALCSLDVQGRRHRLLLRRVCLPYLKCRLRCLQARDQPRQITPTTIPDPVLREWTIPNTLLTQARPKDPSSIHQQITDIHHPKQARTRLSLHWALQTYDQSTT